MTTEQVMAAGGREWKTEDGKFHRIYFNGLSERYGLRCFYYNTGNVSSATLDGETISNSKARCLLSAFDGAKLWFDVLTGTWASKGLRPETQAEFVRQIEEEVARATA